MQLSGDAVRWNTVAELPSAHSIASMTSPRQTAPTGSACSVTSAPPPFSLRSVFFSSTLRCSTCLPYIDFWYCDSGKKIGLLASNRE